jgi:PHD/YefM family antitoxin component YafN of YafNO toxin-antitoxin module
MPFAIRIVCLFLVALTAACSKPEDIILGPEPLKQMTEQADQFKKLSEEDRKTLVAFVSLAEVGKRLSGKEPVAITGRTVAEVLADARKWKADQEIAAQAELKRQEEAKALREKVQAERRAAMAKLQDVLTFTIASKRVLPKDYSVSRFSDMLAVDYAVQNKSAKTIRQVKGFMKFLDSTGDEVGTLYINLERNIAPGASWRGNDGRGWRINEFTNGNIEKIAAASFDGMKTVFEPEVISFTDGEVLRVPE